MAWGIRSIKNYIGDASARSTLPGENGVTSASFETEEEKKKRLARERMDRENKDTPTSDVQSPYSGGGRMTQVPTRVNVPRADDRDDPMSLIPSATQDPETEWKRINRPTYGETNAEYNARMASALGTAPPTAEIPRGQAFDRLSDEEVARTVDKSKVVQPPHIYEDTKQRARSGMLDIDAIAELNLRDNATAELTALYNEGVTSRAEKAAEATRLSEAASAKEQSDASELGRLKGILLDDPNADIGFNALYMQNPEVAKAIQRWMEDPNSEYAISFAEGEDYSDVVEETDTTGEEEVPESSFVRDPYAYDKILNAIKDGRATAYDIGLNVNLNDAQKAKLTETLNTRNEEIEAERRAATQLELNQSYTDRINADEAPTRSEILSSNLSQSQKDSLVALITSKETERRDATRNVNYNELIGRLMGGDGGGISENELNDIDMSDAQRADVRRQLDDWEEAEAERLRIENETATRKEREALEVKNYNELITRFMGGDAVSEYEIGNMQLNDSQRSDLMARFTTYSREQERVQADADRVTLQQTNFNDLMGRIMNNEDIEEYELESIQLSDVQRNEVQARIDHMSKMRVRNALDEKINALPLSLTEAQKTALRNAQEMYGDEGFTDEMNRISGVEADPEELTGFEGSSEEVQQQVAEWREANPRIYGEKDFEYHNRMAWDLKGSVGLRAAPGMMMGQAESITHPWSAAQSGFLMPTDVGGLDPTSLIPTRRDVDPTSLIPSAVDPDVDPTSLIPTRRAVDPSIDPTSLIPKAVDPDVDPTSLIPKAVDPDVDPTSLIPKAVDPDVDPTSLIPKAVDPDVDPTSLIPSADPARVGLFNDFSNKIRASQVNPEIPAPSLFDIERSNLSEGEKERLKAMLLPPKTDEQLLEEEVLRNDQTKATEDHIALYDGKQLIEPEALSDVINDVFDNMAGTLTEEQIVSLVQARLDGNNMHVDSSTLLNTVADIGRGYFAHFQGTRVRPLTFVERKELEVKARDGSTVTATELDPMIAVNALFDKFDIFDQMRVSPEEAYHQALEKGATPTEAYTVFKNAGGSGAPPAGKMVKQEVVTTNADGSEEVEEVEVFNLTPEYGGYGHPFYKDDVYNIASRPGESEEDFWERAEGAEWLTEFKDPDSNVTYSSVSPTESDDIVALMIETLGKNLTDSPEVANFLAGLERFQNTDAFTKSDLRKDFSTALSSALTSFGNYDLDEEKRLMREQAREDYDDQLEEANRYFLVNGLSGSGQEQRQYEDLASNYQTSLRDIDLAISQKKSEYAALQVTTLTDSFASLANIDISTDKLGLEAEDLEERGRQFDASIQAQEKESTDSLALRSRELDITQTQIYENIRQFNKTLGNKINEFAAQYGLSEMETAAMLKKMNSDIINQTRSLSAEIAQGWAGITGVAGDMEGIINLGDLGIPLSEIDAETKELPGMHLVDTDVGRTISQSFQALTGALPTLDQLELLVNGEDLTVAGIPTLESRQIATAIVMQNLDRMNKYDAISKENDLDVERFQNAKQEADRAWYIGIGDVSETFGMSNDGFRDAKYQYDKMYDPLSPDPAKNGDENPDLRYMAETKAKETYMRALGFQPGTDEYLTEQETFNSNWRQANEVFDNTFGNQLKDIAQANKFEESKFLRANEQADLQEEKYDAVWGGLMGAREEEATNIDLYNSHRILFNDTMSYINEYTDIGSSIPAHWEKVYRELATESHGRNMVEVMSGYDPEVATESDYNALISRWREANPKFDDETGDDHRNRAASNIRRYIASANAREMVPKLDSGEVLIADAGSVSTIVDSLMENPPPRLFDSIEGNYGLVDDVIKRDILEQFVAGALADKITQSYGESFSLSHITETGILPSVEDRKSWLNAEKRDEGGWNSVRNQFADYTIFGALDLITPAGRDRIASNQDYAREFSSMTIPEFSGLKKSTDVFSEEGMRTLKAYSGRFEEIWGRPMSIAEAMNFIDDGEIDLGSTEFGMNSHRNISTRLIPENWVDNYKGEGQLEGIFALLNGGNVTPERQVARTSGWAKFGAIAGNVVGAVVAAKTGNPAGVATNAASALSTATQP